LRSCESCGTDISGRHPLATRCELCQAEHRRTRPRTQRHKPPKIRVCSNCGARTVTGKSRKLCDDCRAPKPKLCADGCGAEVKMRGSRCPSCAADHYREYMAAYMRDHREQVKTYKTVYSSIVARAARRARELGLEFALTVALVKRIYPADGCCLVCRVELVWNRGGKGGRVNSPSLDRIDSTRGYVPGNVHVVCLGCNSRKHDKTLAELADGMAGLEWQTWAIAYLAAQNSRPRRRVVHRTRRNDHV
jgi:hypothetical protein